MRQVPAVTQWNFSTHALHRPQLQGGRQSQIEKGTIESSVIARTWCTRGCTQGKAVIGDVANLQERFSLANVHAFGYPPVPSPAPYV